MRWLPCGDTAALVELADLTEVLRLHAAVETARGEGGLEGVTDVVPAARTLLVRCGTRSALERVAPLVDALDLADDVPVSGEEVSIAVRYDGDDLADVAELLDVGTEEVVHRHTETLWRVAFTGFAPGFGYLVADDGTAPLEVARRPEARTTVPAGAVALAGEFSGVYPRSSPGGWQLIGSTETPMWDVDRDPPALLTPGTRVRFEDVR